MSPLESNHRRPTVHFQDLPREGWHHTFESLVAGVEVRFLWAVEVIGGDDCVVRSYFEHMLGRLRRASVDGEGVVGAIDGSPVTDIAFEACLDLPILYKILNEIWKTCCFMALRFGYDTSVRSTKRSSRSEPALTYKQNFC
jgi:hypothetical protein